MKINYTDADRANSRRPKQRQDCVVRALVVTSGIAYDVAYDKAAKAGRKSSRGMMTADMRKLFAAEGYNWIAFKALTGQPRMTARTFCERYPSGKYVLRGPGHVVAVIDGTVHDEPGFLPDKCVYGAWERV